MARTIQLIPVKVYPKSLGTGCTERDHLNKKEGTKWLSGNNICHNLINWEKYSTLGESKLILTMENHVIVITYKNFSDNFAYSTCQTLWVMCFTHANVFNPHNCFLDFIDKGKVEQKLTCLRHLSSKEYSWNLNLGDQTLAHSLNCYIMLHRVIKKEYILKR